MEFFTTLSIGGAIAFVGTIAAALTFSMYVANQIFQIIRDKKDTKKDDAVSTPRIDFHSITTEDINKIHAELNAIEDRLEDKINDSIKDVKGNIEVSNKEFRDSVTRLNERMEKLSYKIIEWLGSNK